jgi:pyridoxamine 5'-phosphate oxidase
MYLRYFFTYMTDAHTFSLASIETEIWHLLHAGSQNPKEAFYTGTLGTQSVSGVELRTVVVREVNTAGKQIFCYSDKRAGKVAEIQANPSVSWLFWDAGKRIQLRLSGTAIVHISDAFTEKHWQQTTPSNRRSYMAISSPGSLLNHPGSGLPADLDTREPTLEESEQGKANFAVIISAIHQIDWLHLGNKGYRRAIFNYENGALTKSFWIVP